MEDIAEDLRATAGDTDAVENASVARLLENAAAEIERLRQAIRRLAEQDATLSACDGNVTVTMDFPLTDAEREAIAWAISDYEENDDDADCARMVSTLRGLLERLGAT